MHYKISNIMLRECINGSEHTIVERAIQGEGIDL